MKKIIMLSLLLIIVCANFRTKAQCVNFTKYQPTASNVPPTGWDNPIVISAITGTNTSEPAFYENQTLYLDIAIINNGTCNATQTVKANVFLDGVFKTTITYPILNANFFGSWQDFVISGPLAVGNHTIQVDIDSPNLIAETNESDNTFTRTFTVQQGACVPTTANTVYNGNRTFTTEHYQATNFRIRDQCQPGTINVLNWNSSVSNPSPFNPLPIVSPNNSWTSDTQRSGASAMWAIQKTYNYFSAVHGRNSWNNNNAGVTCYVNTVFTGGNLNNASMLNGTMWLGPGNSLNNSWGTLDIVGHEFTHDVVGTSANLAYQYESGALNESFADIFGESIENYILGSNDWLIGANRTSGAIRNMANPNTYAQPDTYGGTNWISQTCPSPTDANDQCGVHTNSGVQNFWFYLLSQGGSGTNDKGNAFNVTSIGISKARAIAFRTLTINLLGQPNANYATARTASIQSAQELYGVSSVEASTVTNAWCAVGIGTAPTAVTASGGGTFCNSTTITASGGAGGTIYWQGTDGNGISTATPSTSQVVSSSGTYYFRSNNGCGWSAAGSVTVVINNVPNAVAVSGGGTFCNSTTITATGGSGGTIYFQGTISNGTFFGSTSTSQIPNSSGTYYFRANNSCGWGTQGSATVTISNVPSAVSLGGGGTFCNSTTITASGGTGGTVYWQGTTSSGISTATPSTSQVVSLSGTYYFRANNGCGWGAQGSAAVNIISNVLNLSGIAINGLQKAGQTISSTQNIPFGTNASYEAGNSILLQSTFTAETGGIFKAEIKGCNN